jgi:HEAT repeat protein
MTPRRLAALLALALLVPGCGKDSEEEETRQLKQDLARPGYQRWKIRQMAAKGLPYLRSLLAGDDRVLRISAINALGELPDNPEAVDLLVELCEGTDPEDAHWAVLSLAYLGAPEAKAIIPRFVRSPEARRREGAAIAIWVYGDSTLYPLLDLLGEDDDPRVRTVAQSMKRRLAGPTPSPKD